MKRLKKVLKVTAIVAGALVALLLIANAVFVWYTGSRLEERLSALRKAGEPLQLADFAREPIPPERNAETFLRRVADDMQAIEKELNALYPRVGYPKGKPTPAEQEKLKSLFAAYPRLIPTLEQAADAPDNDPQLDVTLPRDQFLQAYMDQAGRHRPLYRILRARSALLLAQGHPDDAVTTQLLLLRITRHWRREPMLLGYLVTAVGEYVAVEVINDVLQSGPVAPATRQAIDAELARHDTMEGYAQALRGERAFALTTVRGYPSAGYWLPRGFVNDLMIRLLDLYDIYLGDADRPFVQVSAERFVQVPGERKRPRSSGVSWNSYGLLVTMLEPSLIAALEAGDRVRAMCRSLRILNALQRRAPAGSDPVPPLGDLGLPAGVTTDPFDGQPLRLKKSPRGWIVYSVGGNGVDDGGQLGKAVDIGVGPVGPEEAAKTP